MHHYFHNFFYLQMDATNKIKCIAHTHTHTHTHTHHTHTHTGRGKAHEFMND